MTIQEAFKKYCKMTEFYPLLDEQDQKLVEMAFYGACALMLSDVMVTEDGSSAEDEIDHLMKLRKEIAEFWENYEHGHQSNKSS